MYKPTSYLTIEADPDHATPDGMRTLARLFGFIDPLSCVPAEELGISIRLKCSGRTYWNNNDNAQNAMWDNVVGKFLKAKLSVILNVLEECNKKEYAHYEEPLRFRWLKLLLEPCEIRIRLDHGAEGANHLPDAFHMVETVRAAMSTPEPASFLDGWPGVVAYVPCLETIEQYRTIRTQEEASWQMRENEREEIDPATHDMACDPLSNQPPLAEPMPYDTVELVRADGASLIRSALSLTQR